MNLILALCTGMCLAAALHAQTPECPPLPGADSLWTRPNLRFILVGEMHGTTETPQAFRDLVCAAHRAKRPLLVGVERPTAEQKAIERFLAPEDHGNAVDALLREPGWAVLDGRSSRAMLTLLEELRTLRLRGDIEEVTAFDDARAGETPAQREQRMAAMLTAAADRLPDCLVIVLTGNLHASKKPVARFGSYSWMAMLLPSAETISLVVTDRGGQAWTQTADGCGPHALGPSGGDQRSVVLAEPRASQRGFDGALSTGLSSTASPPATPGAPQTPACSN
ncbi:MAG TPA: hypothetical protein VGH38_12580 [Bryobacteraceae bacterium]